MVIIDEMMMMNHELIYVHFDYIPLFCKTPNSAHA